MSYTNKPNDAVSVKDYGAKGNGIADDTASIQAALNWAVANNSSLYFPRGIYLVTSGLTITGNPAGKTGEAVRIFGVGIGFDLDPSGSTIKWGGSTNASNNLFTANGIGRLIVEDMAFHGNLKVGTVFYATQGISTYAPFGWIFNRVYFAGVIASPTNQCFLIDTSTNMGRFQWNECFFIPGTGGGTGFNSQNPNALSNHFIGCSFGPGDYGIHIGQGAFHAFSCDFTQNNIADVYLQIHNPCSLYGCWSEQSRQFILTDFREQYSSLTLSGCQSASYPWSWWKLDETHRTQPTNDLSQWVSISWDRPAGLNVIGCTFDDPFLFSPVGSIAPTTSSQPTIRVPNGHANGFDVIMQGSYSMNGIGPTFGDQFVFYGTDPAAERMGYRRSSHSTIHRRWNISAS
jgi:hypothetical protein